MYGWRKARRPQKPVSQFLGQNLPIMMLADVGNVIGEAREKLTKWIEDGGVLVRFAGPRLAASEDDLVPVRLRRGGRTLGGSLSWDQPQHLSGFSREGPFSGMAVPTDVTVQPAGSGGAGCRAFRSHLGDARGRHAACHRRAPWQGRCCAVPYHRRYALVGPADLRHLRRHAQAHRSDRRQPRRCRERSRRPAGTARSRAAEPGA